MANLCNIQILRTFSRSLLDSIPEHRLHVTIEVAARRGVIV